MVDRLSDEVVQILQERGLFKAEGGESTES